MTKQSIHIGGVPTGPAIRKLDEKYPDIGSLRGTFLLHEEIEKIIGEKYGTTRYKTIVDRWRRLVRKRTGIVIDGQGEARGLGYRVTDDNEQSDYAMRKEQSAGRRVRDSIRALNDTDDEKLTEERRLHKQYRQFALAKVHALLLHSKKLPEPTKPPDQRPQIPSPVN